MDFSPKKTTIGVVGAGTMGSGIALAALYKGFKVILYDAYPEALENAKPYIEKFLAKKELDGNLALLTLAKRLEDFAPANVVIEAALEDIDLKRELFSKLDTICPPPAILATNTSTLAVTAIAAATQTPERVIGMHFFNPAPVLPLVEVVRAPKTGDEAAAAIVALAEQLGKEPVLTQDSPGFIVNRVARPFYGEALRLLGEGVAGHEEIDTIVELGGGFRMGPFRLMDLIGIDINTAAMQSMYEQTYGEPRYRPHWIQVQKVQAGALGRKSGAGFYEYDDGESKLPEPPAVGGGEGVILVSEGTYAPGLRELLEEAGYTISTKISKDLVAGFILSGRDENLQELVARYDGEIAEDIPLFVQAADVSVAEAATWMQRPERLIGFDGLFLANGLAATLTPSPVLEDEIQQKAENTAHSLGRKTFWIKESPAMVLPRIVGMLVNEAAFAHLEGVAEADVIDKAMRLGVNYPRGPLEWGKQLGYSRVLAVLDHLHAEYKEERYRACVLLRRWARLEQVHAGR